MAGVPSNGNFPIKKLPIFLCRYVEIKRRPIKNPAPDTP